MKIRIYEPDMLSFFPIYPSTASVNTAQPKTLRTEGYPMHQIFLVSAGEGILNIGGQSYILSENDFYYIAANVPHEYYGRDSLFSTTYLSFFGDGFEKIQRYYQLGDFGVYQNKNRGLFEASVQNLFDVFDTMVELSSLCSMTFSTLIAYFDEACKKEYSPIETVHHYIQANFAKAITLEDILEIYPYSQAKLCRDFKKQYNMTVFEAITRIRLQHAHHMMKGNPHIRLSSIASSCGFNDVSYFCKMYKRFYGCSPKSVGQ